MRSATLRSSSDSPARFAGFFLALVIGFFLALVIGFARDFSTLVKAPSPFGAFGNGPPASFAVFP